MVAPRNSQAYRMADFHEFLRNYSLCIVSGGLMYLVFIEVPGQLFLFCN
jgi:hypothetical protein